MHIYHATYAVTSTASYKRETLGIKAFSLEEAYQDAVEYLPKLEAESKETWELDSIMKGVKAI